MLSLKSDRMILLTNDYIRWISLYIIVISEDSYLSFLASISQILHKSMFYFGFIEHK